MAPLVPFRRSSSDGPDDPVLRQALRQLASAEKHAKEVHAAKARAQEVYLPGTPTERERRRRQLGKGNWRSDLYPAVAFEHIETKIANVCDSSPEFDPEPRLEQFRNNVDSVRRLMSYFLDRDRFTRSYRTTMRRAVKYGDCPVKVVWKRETCRVKEQRPDPHWQPDLANIAAAGGVYDSAQLQPPMVEVEVEYDLYNGPTIIPLDYRDFFPDPTARTMDEAGFVFHRWRATLQELKDRVDDNGDPFYTNLDQLPSNASAEDAGDKHKNETSESREARTTGMHTIHERWTRYGVLVIANRSVVIRYDEDPHNPVFDHRKVPFEVVRLIEDDDNLGGVSTALVVSEFQDAYRTFLNAMVDAVTLATRPPKLVDEELDQNAGKYEIYPDALIPARNGLQTVHVFQDIAGLDKYGMERLLDVVRDLIERGTGMNSVVGGLYSARSATVGNNALSQSMKRLTFEIETSDDDWSRVMELCFALVQQYVDQRTVFEVTGGDNIDVSPHQIAGQFLFKPRLSTEKALREQRQNALTTVLSTIAPFIQPGTVEFTQLEGLLKDYFRAFDVADPQAVARTSSEVQIEQAQLQMQIEQAQAEHAASLPQPQQAPPASPPPHETIIMQYDKAPPSIQRQIEQASGFQPASPEETRAQIDAMKPTGQGMSGGSAGP